MFGEYITGKELMEKYGLQPAELGKLCHESKLAAYDQVELRRIYDWGPIKKHRQENRALRDEIEQKIYERRTPTSRAEPTSEERAMLSVTYWPQDAPDGLYSWLLAEEYIQNKKEEANDKLWRDNNPTKEDFFEQYRKLWEGRLFKRSDIDTWLKHTPAGQNSPAPIPVSTGSNKDKARIEATRRACETVRAEIGQEKHGFQVGGKYKTNRVHFMCAVQEILGDEKPHRDTARAEWKKVPDNLKHNGKVPEQ